MIIFKILKNIFIAPAAIVYFLYIVIVAIREQIKGGAWNEAQYAEFATRVAVHLRNHIESIEWLSFVIWCGVFIYFFNVQYAKWIY